jgi:hypothetical protein
MDVLASRRRGRGAQAEGIKRSHALEYNSIILNDAVESPTEIWMSARHSDASAATLQLHRKRSDPRQTFKFKFPARVTAWLGQ